MILPGAAGDVLLESYQTRRMLGMGGLQGGSVPGGWHQQ